MDAKWLDRDQDGFEKAINSSHGYEGLVDTVNYASKRQPNVGIFKLADETQMGGLNSLMFGAGMNYAKHNNNIGEVVDQNKEGKFEWSQYWNLPFQINK